MRVPSAEQKGLILKTTVIKGRNLAAKDKGGTSDPVSLPLIKKLPGNLNAHDPKSS